jgi:hypothetical protein
MKYTVDYISGVATRIATRVDSPISEFGKYTEGVLEPFFPTEDDLLDMSRREVREWTRANNKRLRAICKFLNKNKL